MPAPSSVRQTLLWTALLDASAILGSLALACLMPFVGLGVAAALTLPWRVGVSTVLVAWGANQAIGYGLLGFPTDHATILRGVGIGVCALIAFAVGRLGRRRDGSLSLARAAAAFVGAFAAYEVAMYGFALMLGGTGTFTPAIVRLIGLNDAAWFAGLMALWLVATGVAPARFGRPPAVRLA